ncbi:MAG: SCO family protein [Bacteroidetes bacterium]|nr:SCO family protein [Bacteroidota bacterium]
MKSVAAFAFILVVAIAVAYYLTLQTNRKELPFINPNDVQQEMVDSSLFGVGHGHRIGAFRLIDEQNKVITDKAIDGKVFVAEYFFATCKSICPIMNQQMQRVQARFKGERNFNILSFTVDPDTDTPGQLLAYAKKHGYSPGQWHFITGSKDSLYRLARTSFFVLKPAEAQNLGDAGNDFIHTNNFVLVDKQRQIRGYYDGTNPSEVDQLIKDIEILLNNP